MTSTITITTAFAPNNESVAFMLTILEVALTGVTLALAVVTALIAMFAVFGRRDIIQKAEEVAHNSAQKAAQNTADKAVKDFLQPANISGIVERHITERADEVAGLVAEKMADRLYRKQQGQEQQNKNTPAPSDKEKTEENKDV